MILDLNLSFPEPSNPGVARGPLPKQKQFIEYALDPKGPKYVAYYGGIGSGKSLVLCITMLTQAVIHGGEYVIARQFMPELRRTTMRAFLEICPKELIVEYRVADAEVHIRSASGKPAIIYFVGLDEPDKLRSLNLSGGGIDEASQVSEEAFLLLQGRLRNPKGLRKLLLVGNPAGHNWVYQYFVKQDLFKNPEAKLQYKVIVAPSTENKHLPDGYVQGLLDSYSDERIQREVMGSWDAFEGQVYHEFRRDVHVIKPFVIPPEWTKVVGADHGYRNPAAWVWGAQDYDGNLYIYREFYQREWLIEEICKGNKKTREPGVIELNRKDKLDGIWMDPSTKAARGQTGASDWDSYAESLPKQWPLLPAKNEVGTGIDRVKGYLKVNERSGKPRLFIFDTCTNLIEEIAQYRWEERAHNQQAKHNEKEAPVKKNDHACLRADTAVDTLEGVKALSEIRIGDLIKTTLGYLPVAQAGVTGVKPLYRYTFTDGTYLDATPDHPILLTSGSKLAIRDLTPSDTIVKISTCSKLHLMGLYSGRLVNTTEQTVRTVKRALNLCIEKFGNTITDLFPRITTYTMSTAIPTITQSLTLSALAPLNTYLSTGSQKMRLAGLKQESSTWSLSGPSQLSGTGPRPGVNGIGNMLSAWLRKLSILKKSLKRAYTAVRASWLMQPLPLDPSSVTRTVEPPTFVGVEKVYNLSIDGCSEFFANGILVSNCDALRYLVMSRPEAPKHEDIAKRKLGDYGLEASLYKELQQSKRPGPKDPIGDF